MNNTEIRRNALFAMGGRVAAGLMVVVLFSACGGLPTSGPSGNKVVALGEQQATVAVPEVELIDLDEGVARKLYQRKSNQSFAQFG